jgi:hypothetical protein
MVALTDHYPMIGQANRNQVLQANRLLSWVDYQRVSRSNPHLYAWIDN